MQKVKYKLAEGQYEYSIDPVLIKNEQLKNITVSYQAKSETRYITPVLINLKDLGYVQDSTVIICDAPGKLVIDK